MLFKIKADKLLVAGDDTQFDGSGDLFVAHQIGGNSVLRHQRIERVGGFVVADYRQQPCFTAQRSDVARDVRRSARPLVDSSDFRHRHGRFGRNTGHVAKPIAVEHHVADNKDFGLCETGFEGFLLELGGHIASVVFFQTASTCKVV